MVQFCTLHLRHEGAGGSGEVGGRGVKTTSQRLLDQTTQARMYEKTPHTPLLVID